jgi:hypothetical protein
MLEIGIVAFAVVVGWRACCVQIASMRQHDNIFFSTSPWFRPHVRGVGDAVVNSQGSGGQEPSPGRDSPILGDLPHALVVQTIHISPQPCPLPGLQIVGYAREFCAFQHVKTT